MPLVAGEGPTMTERFPWLSHRSMAEIMRNEARREAWREAKKRQRDLAATLARWRAVSPGAFTNSARKDGEAAPVSALPPRACPIAADDPQARDSGSSPMKGRP